MRLFIRTRFRSELGFGGTDAGERELADAVAGDDSVQRAFGLYRSRLHDAACDCSSGQDSDLSWDSAGQTLANGSSPTQWQVTIPFNALSGYIDPDYTTLHAIVHPDKIPI